MKNKKKLIVAAAIVIIAVLGLFGYFHSLSGRLGNRILVSGNIETTEIRLSFQIPGKIIALLTDEGRSVKKGDVVARLDTEELTKIKEQAEFTLQDARFNYEWVREDYNRAENLFKNGATTAQQRDAVKNRFDSSEARLKISQAALELANVRLSYADLISPVDGFVLVKSAEAGEVVQQGSPIFTVADLTDVWVTAYINETDLGRVKLNQEVDVKTDTYPDKIYKGRISFISQEAEFTPKQIQTTEERVKLVYRIKIAVENPNFELKPGMPADGYIRE
jgi:HlyD family secretion protein